MLNSNIRLVFPFVGEDGQPCQMEEGLTIQGFFLMMASGGFAVQVPGEPDSLYALKIPNDIPSGDPTALIAGAGFINVELTLTPEYEDTEDECEEGQETVEADLAIAEALAEAGFERFETKEEADEAVAAKSQS